MWWGVNRGAQERSRPTGGEVRCGWKEASFPSGGSTDGQERSKLQVESGKLPENTWMTSIFSMTHEAKLSAESEGAGIANRSSEAC